MGKTFQLRDGDGSGGGFQASRPRRTGGCLRRALLAEELLAEELLAEELLAEELLAEELLAEELLAEYAYGFPRVTTRIAERSSEKGRIRA